MQDELFNAAPRIDQLSPQIAVAFSPKKFRSASVCWINTRWFLSNGVDVLEDVGREWANEWLMAEFAYGVPRPEWDKEPPEFYTDQTREMHADRYGAPGGTPDHGGSGRCGMAGSFNAKGIGPTPLVDEQADWYHAHGCMWLEEALREAILSEIAWAEFPLGAIPAIAVICIHDIHHRKDGSAEPTRAILVRPNFIRPAHFERSILFGAGGYEDSPQYLDSVRTADAIRTFCLHSNGSISLNVRTRSLHEMLEKIAIQIGFGWAHRLFHGGYFSSNITIDGELVDFGSFRALPSWHRAFTVSSAAPFGNELDALSPMISSLAFYFSKYGDEDNQIHDLRELQRRMSSAAKLSFDRACLDAVFASDRSAYSEDEQAKILRVIYDYFGLQQLTVVDYFSGEHKRKVEWAFSAFANGSGPPRDTEAPSETMASALKQILTSDRSGVIDRGLTQVAAAKRWLRPRRLAYRENLARVIDYMLRKTDVTSGDFAKKVDALVMRIVARSRRHWRGLPADIVLSATSSAGYCTALYCTNASSNQVYFRIEAALWRSKAYLFGIRLPLELLAEHNLVVSGEGSIATFVVPAEPWDFKRPASIEVSGVRIEVPLPDIIFEPVVGRSKYLAEYEEHSGRPST